MKTIARLIWQYFTSTPLQIGFTIAGLVLLLAAGFVLGTQPQSGALLWLAILGIIAFFLGGSMMPLMFGRLARSHSIGVLPYGRLKLLLSAFLTVFIVALPASLIAPIAFVAATAGSATDLVKYGEMLDYTVQLTKLTFTSSFLLAGWLYLAMWFITSQRNMAGMFKGLLVLLIMVFAPAREIQELSVSFVWNLQQIAAIWGVFGIAFLLWPRWRAMFARQEWLRSPWLRWNFRRSVSGHEFDQMLGTANPWWLIAAQLLPLLLAAKIAQEVPSVWLYILTIFTTVSGAIAGQAAGRSRALWLKGNWSRGELFAQVELSFWRYNSYVLGSLMLFMVGIGSYAGLSSAMLVAGLPLLALGTVLSTYLGFMITRGLRVSDAVLGVAVMLTLMAISVLVARESVDPFVILGLEAALAVLAIILRETARRRWLHIDWVLCRPERALSARGAS